MKHHVFSIFLLATIVISCREKKSIEERMNQQSTRCYRSISNGDTAYLNIDTASKDVIGLLEFNYVDDKKIYKGQFEGRMSGDTLKGHYDFKLNNINKWYRNPVAFLKRNGQFTMGVGKFAMVWGSAYFDEKVPINYEKGRFVFEQGECEFKTKTK